MNKDLIFGSLILGLCLLGGSYFLAQSLEYQKDFERFIKVKGLAEKKVKSDKSIWTLNYIATGNSLSEIYSKVSNSKLTITNFLRRIGVQEKEIEYQNVKLNDNTSYRGKIYQNATRFRATSGVIITNHNVDFIKKSSQGTNELIQKGVTLTGNKVKYLFENLNTIKQEMLTEAMKNAKLAAKSFLKGSETKVV